MIKRHLSTKIIMIYIYIYIIFSIIKFFTCSMGFQIEEDPIIMLKFFPTITNKFYGTDNYINTYMNKYAWYRNHYYFPIIETYGSAAINIIYDIIISVWWILSAVLIIFIILKIMKIRG